ncbi:hypothetical protein ES707_22872 [subsurface metagenome]
MVMVLVVASRLMMEEEQDMGAMAVNIRVAQVALLMVQ